MVLWLVSRVVTPSFMDFVSFTSESNLALFTHFPFIANQRQSLLTWLVASLHLIVWSYLYVSSRPTNVSAHHKLEEVALTGKRVRTGILEHQFLL